LLVLIGGIVAEFFKFRSKFWDIFYFVNLCFTLHLPTVTYRRARFTPHATAYSSLLAAPSFKISSPTVALASPHTSLFSLTVHSNTHQCSVAHDGLSFCPLTVKKRTEFCVMHTGVCYPKVSNLSLE